PLDWVGFHFYTRRVVADASDTGGFGGGFSGTEIESDSGSARDPYTGIRAAMPTEGPLTDSGMEVWPRGIYDLVTQISREYNHPVIEITESGCAYNDGPDASGAIRDARRVEYHRQYLAALARAIADGADVRGYHAWSLIDNFEWAEGFSQRFGLAYVDFKTQQRTIKESGRWYAKVAAENLLRVGT
ncbi:MAG: family 1 glycosylhydrolase, partial [Candidatus Sulfotelmatobacter sp.]